jgi:peptidoglycan hydrolase CwlO-like protein
MKLLDYQSELKPLSEEKAIEMGSNFIAEVLIFGIGASCIIAEAYRSSSNTKKKTKGMEMDIDQVEEQLEELKTRLVKSEMEVEQLKMLLGQVDKRIDRVQDTFQLLNH